MTERGAGMTMRGRGDEGMTGDEAIGGRGSKKEAGRGVKILISLPFALIFAHF